MALRLHSRLVLWNLFLVSLASFILSFFLTASQLALMIVVAVAAAFIFTYGVHVLVLRPLHRISLVSRKLASGNLDERLPIAGDEQIAALGTSLNTMAQALSARMQALLDEKQQLELILAAMGQGVMVLDHDGRITLANSSLLRVLGTDRNLNGKTPLEVFRRPELENAVKAVLRGKPIETLEITVGKNSILQANVAPVTNAAGIRTSAVVVFNDMTEIRRAERMRRDFVANVSHEFKTPLTSIRGYTETLLSGAKDDPKIASEFLRIIERNAQNLEALVSDLLVLAKLEAELPATREAFDLMFVIKEQIHISADTRNGTLNLVVSDTGNGIPSEALPRIFERFYRVDKARARESGGTGLGLAIVKHAIESQGGTISVASQLGSGSTFTIHLPL